MQVLLPVLRLNRVPAQRPAAVTGVGVVRCYVFASHHCASANL